MNKIDYLDLDGRLLRLLLVVLEEGSVTKAAQRLDVTQSAVSHMLDRLREIVGDPLFVKAGRGIVATARAEAMAAKARALLDELRDLAGAESFEPATRRIVVTIAANDFQRDLLLPMLVRRIGPQAPGLRLRVIPSGVPTAELLREEKCQLLITPRPPDGNDILQKRLFENPYLVFFDAACRDAPRTLEQYLQAEHVTVQYENNRPLDIDRLLVERHVRREFRMTVPNFSGVAPFLRGSTWLATLPGLLRAEMLRGFGCCELPLACPAMPMYMVWHRRHHADPLQQWLRAELEAVVAPAIARAGA